MAVVDAKRREAPTEEQFGPPLIQGTDMVCPRCRRKHNILRYTPMGQVDEFKSETNPIYKCPTCRWIFSPSDSIILEAMLDA